MIFLLAGGVILFLIILRLTDLDDERATREWYDYLRGRGKGGDRWS